MSSFDLFHRSEALRDGEGEQLAARIEYVVPMDLEENEGLRPKTIGWRWGKVGLWQRRFDEPEWVDLVVGRSVCCGPVVQAVHSTVLEQEAR